MSNIIIQYYDGILRQLRSEVDFINSIFHHQGVRGQGNEIVLRELLERFLPKKYGVGTGVVIDKDGNQSRQCDIVIYDNNLYPSLLALRSVHLFPVDIVYATVEVKATLDATSAREAVTNVASVRSLKLVLGEFFAEQHMPDTSDVMYSQVIAAPTPPLGIVFAYNSSVQQLETFHQWFQPNTETQIVGVPEVPVLSSPSLVGCLDQGLLLFTNEDDMPAEQPSSEYQFRAWMLPVWEGDLPVKVTEVGDTFRYGGQTYPVRKANNVAYAIDQSRVLLAFVLLLHEFLATKMINPRVNFIHNYLKNTPSLKRVVHTPGRAMPPRS